MSRKANSSQKLFPFAKMAGTNDVYIHLNGRQENRINTTEEYCFI